MGEIKIGQKAPSFVLPDENEINVSLKDFLGKKLIIYFYPKDMTSGCTLEACDFRDNFPRFEKLRINIVGISKDSIRSHKKFKEKYNLLFTLLSDENDEVCEKYGVWKEKSMYGRKYMGIERTTFIIDEKGKIQSIFPKVKVRAHVEELLSLLNK